MTLRSQIASDAASVILNTNDLAETVTYHPRDGASRSVVAVVYAVQSPSMDENGNELHIESIQVTCMRDKDHAKGGIDSPSIEDTIVRAASVDPDTRPYAYANEKPHIDQSLWTLVFWRYKRTAQGIS